jgi:hypothetical protein
LSSTARNPRTHPPPQRDVALFNAVAEYAADARGCRHARLIEYLGERWPAGRCGSRCDACRGEVEPEPKPAPAKTRARSAPAKAGAAAKRAGSGGASGSGGGGAAGDFRIAAVPAGPAFMSGTAALRAAKEARAAAARGQGQPTLFASFKRATEQPPR